MCLVLLGVVILIAFLAGIMLRPWYIATRRLNDYNWLAQATAAQQRDTAHEVLSLPMGNQHDAFVILMHVGTRESVPYLIRALRWQPHTAAGGRMACEKMHCLEALRNITRVDLGNNYEDWAAWWEEQGKWDSDEYRAGDDAPTIHGGNGRRDGEGCPLR